LNRPDKIMTKEKISYNSAVTEMEAILEKIEGGNLDVDELTDKVARVTMLLKICRKKLHLTEAQIDQILDKSDETHAEDSDIT
jgi:exodeoxyribonuclease VII small subunit